MAKPRKRRFKKRARLTLGAIRYKRVYTRFEALYKLLAMSGVCALVSSAVYAAIYRSFERFAPLVAVGFGVGGVVIGYALSALWGLLTSCERVRSDYSYEKLESYYDKKTLFLSVISAALAAYGASRIAYMLTGTVTQSGQVIRDSADMLPAIVGWLIFGCMLTGLLLWFVPYNKVISVGNAIPLGLGFFIVMLITTVYMGADVTFVTVAFALYVLCAMSVVSQGYLIRIIGESGTGSATVEVRKYNFAAVLLAYGMLAVAGIGVTAVLVGFTVLARFLSVLLLGRIIGSGGASGKKPTSGGGGSVAEGVFGEILGVESEATNIFFFALFLLMFIGFFVYLFIRLGRGARKIPKPSEIIAWLYSLALRIIAFAVGLFTGKLASEDDIILEDYADEELKMAKGADALPKTDTRSGMKRFNRMLAACKSENERLALCYKVSRAGYIRDHRILRVGDTPSALSKKLAAILPGQDSERFERLTRAYEAMAYAGIQPSERIKEDLDAEIAFIRGV